MEKFIEKLQEIFSNDVITENTALNSLPNFDSLDILSIIYMVNEEYKIPLEVNDLLDHIVVIDLYNFITNR